MKKVFMEMVDPLQHRLSDYFHRPPAPVLDLKTTPSVEGDGDTDCLCPGCDQVLLHDVDAEYVQDIVFRCPHCKTLSRVPPGR